jgi:iron complex outermembrane receptor protein
MRNSFLKTSLIAAGSILALTTAARADAAPPTEADGAPAVEQVIVTAERRATDLQKDRHRHLGLRRASPGRPQDRQYPRPVGPDPEPEHQPGHDQPHHPDLFPARRRRGRSDPGTGAGRLCRRRLHPAPDRLDGRVQRPGAARGAARPARHACTAATPAPARCGVITRDPGQEVRAKAEVGLGNLGAVDVRALVEGPLVADKLAGSFSYIHHSRDGTAYDPTLGPRRQPHRRQRLSRQAALDADRQAGRAV